MARTFVPIARRALLARACALTGAVTLGGFGTAEAFGADPPTPPPAMPPPTGTFPAEPKAEISAEPPGPDSDLMRAALAEWAARAAAAPRRQLIGLVDFSIPSYRPRFFLVRPATRTIVGAYLVAHGVGSDPGPNPGPVPRLFSNVVNSEASCIGGFVTTHTYEGRHGLSLRIRGLDPTDDNAEKRDVVIHSAVYVDAERAARGLPIERSEGCFAVTHADRDTIIAALRDGAFLYAGPPLPM